MDARRMTWSDEPTLLPTGRSASRWQRSSSWPCWPCYRRPPTLPAIGAWAGRRSVVLIALVLAGCDFAASSQWPLPSVGHPWGAADAAACFSENQDLIAVTKAFDADTIDTNPLYVTGPSIATARARFASALSAFVDDVRH